MESKGSKILTIVALIVAVLCLTVAYAALSQNLTIEGTATVEGNTWDVHFGSITKKEEGATATYTAGNTSIEDLVVTFTKPGDKVTLTIPVKNYGTIAAKLSDVVGKGTTLSFKGDGDEDVSTEKAKIQNDIKYTVQYNSNTIAGDTDVSKLSDISLKAATSVEQANGGEATITLTAEYVKQTANQQLPGKTIVVEGLDRTFTFVQDDSAE